MEQPARYEFSFAGLAQFVDDLPEDYQHPPHADPEGRPSMCRSCLGAAFLNALGFPTASVTIANYAETPESDDVGYRVSPRWLMLVVGAYGRLADSCFHWSKQNAQDIVESVREELGAYAD